MKKISVVVPCFNEADNIEVMCETIEKMFAKQLTEYDYELLFIDNSSTDLTKSIIRRRCLNNKKVKAIFNSRNFGPLNSTYYGLLQSNGDCSILLACDFQDPVELIPQFINEWENGYKIVVGIKNKSQEHMLMYRLRAIYYRFIKSFSGNIEQIEQFTGFGLYDRKFVDIMRTFKDPIPFLRGIVAEVGFTRKEILFEQPKRKAGKTHFNLYSLYDFAMLSITSYTKVGLRMCTFFSIGIGIISFLIGIIYLVMKLVYWNSFQMGIAPMLIGVFFIGSLQLFFIGMIGEYILNINQRIMNRPLVIEEDRINFKDTSGDKFDEI